MSKYDAWLEEPYVMRANEEAAWEAASDTFESGDGFMPTLIEWLADQLRLLGTVPVNTEECDCSLPQEFIDKIVEEFRESHTYESVVEAMLDDDEVEPDELEPDDFDRSDPYDIEYDR